MRTLCVLVLLVVSPCLAALHPSSPCPAVFSYEGNQPEHERWYGIVYLTTDESLVGVRIDVKLDRPAEVFVSWMGTVTTKDNELFTIFSLDQRLNPGPPTESRFMVKFNAITGSPQVRTIRLNGKQICPPDSNFPTDIQSGGQDYLYENKHTTDRNTRRPDLDFEDDGTNPRPVTPPYKPPGSYNSHGSSGSIGSGSYNSHGSSGSTGSGSYNSHGSSGSTGSGSYNSHGSSGSTGTGSYNSHGPSGSTGSDGYSSSGSSGYSNTHDSGSYSSHTSKGNTHTTTDGYNSHETYNTHQKPSGSSYSNKSRPGSINTQEYHPTDTDLRPLLTHNTDGGPRPSININIHKDITFNVERPDESSKDPSHSNNQYPKTTEKHPGLSGGGIKDDIYSRQTTTTKKPIVINSINININSGDADRPNEDSNYSPSTYKPTTKRPYSSNKNSSSTNSNRQTTQRPTNPGIQRPTSGSGHQNIRPIKNTDMSSSETYYEPGYGQNNQEETTARTSSNYPGSNKDQHNSRPGSGGGNKKPQRPQTPGSQNKGEGNHDSSHSNVKCGSVVVNPSPTPLITHGQNTARGQWPWHIALYRIEGINLSYSCGGSLISSTVVVTAAHCVTKGPRDRPVDADILVVQLGKYHLYQFSDDSVQNKQVQTLYVHPRYNSTNYLDDLAVLILSSPAEFTTYVRPVCLWPKNNFNLQNIDNKEGTVVGWGYDENNQVTEELKMARMPVVSYVTCLKSYPQFFSQFTAENKTFCAGFRQGTSVCNGDSGGGMVFQQNNLWYLRGLVSITVAKQGLRVCDTNHYVVFTDVAHYVDWINQYIS